MRREGLLFGTTEEFLRSFGVKSIEELPKLNAVQVEEFKQPGGSGSGVEAGYLTFDRLF